MTMKLQEAIASGRQFMPATWENEWLEVGGKDEYIRYTHNKNIVQLTAKQLCGDFHIKEKEVTITKTKLFEAISSALKEQEYRYVSVPGLQPTHVDVTKLVKALGLED